MAMCDSRYGPHHQVGQFAGCFRVRVGNGSGDPSRVALLADITEEMGEVALSQ